MLHFVEVHRPLEASTSTTQGKWVACLTLLYKSASAIPPTTPNDSATPDPSSLALTRSVGRHTADTIAFAPPTHAQHTPRAPERDQAAANPDPQPRHLLSAPFHPSSTASYPKQSAPLPIPSKPSCEISNTRHPRSIQPVPLSHYTQSEDISKSSATTAGAQFESHTRDAKSLTDAAAPAHP